MARQPLRAAVALLALAGCPEREPYTGAFDEPRGIGVLQPEVGGPFREPVALVANHHGGQIVPLAVKQGRFLTDDATVSFLRTNPLPTGALRLLTGIAVTSEGTRSVTAWVGDERFGTLLRVPWILDCAAEGPRPECASAVGDAPVEQDVFVEVLSSPDGARLEDLRVTRGYTATETWTILFDGTDWTVEGSRSGRLPQSAETGIPYVSEHHRLEFTIEGTASSGDRFEVKTRSGLEEIGVGGAPLALSLAPDRHTLALVVHDRVLDRPVLRWFDTDTKTVVGNVDLPADARPHRLAWTEDGRLLAPDSERPAVWEVEVGATTATEHVFPWPVLDVAELQGDRSQLFVVPIDGRSMWRADRSTDELLDVNPTVEGLQGMPFESTIVGVEALLSPYRMPEYTDDGVRRYGRSVAISLSTGNVVFAHEDDGCLVQDNLGPRSALDTTASFNFDYTSTFQGLIPGTAVLEENDANGRHVLVNRCAGIAASESWTMRYDQNLQAWTVRGSLSGFQEALAYEDERYLSDDGEVSFTVRAGSTPSQEGWSVRFSVSDGIATATGDSDGDQLRDVNLGTGGEPVYVEYRVGLAGPIGSSEGEGWYPVDIRPMLLLPGVSTDEVGRVDPQRATVDVGWL